MTGRLLDATRPDHASDEMLLYAVGDRLVLEGLELDAEVGDVVRLIIDKQITSRAAWLRRVDLGLVPGMQHFVVTTVMAHATLAGAEPGIAIQPISDKRSARIIAERIVRENVIINVAYPLMRPRAVHVEKRDANNG